MRFREKMIRECAVALLSISTIIGCSLLYFVGSYSVKQSQSNLKIATELLTQEVNRHHYQPNTLSALSHVLMSTGRYQQLIIRDAQGKEIIHEKRIEDTTPRWVQQLPFIQQAEQHTTITTPKKELLGTIEIVPNMSNYITLVGFIQVLSGFWLLALFIGFLIFRRLIRGMQNSVEAIVEHIAHEPSSKAHKTYLSDEFNIIISALKRTYQRLQRLLSDKLSELEREHHSALFNATTQLLETDSFIHVCDEYLNTPSISKDASYLFIRIEGFQDMEVILQGITPTIQSIMQNYCPRGFAGIISTQPYTFCLVNPQQENTKLISMILEENLVENIEQMGAHPYHHAIRIIGLSEKQLIRATDIIEAGQKHLDTIQPLSKGMLCETRLIYESIEQESSEKLSRTLITIERVLRTGQLALVVQPTYRVDKLLHKAIIGYEIFSRIPMEHDHFMKAADFLPILYQANMGDRLDLLVTELTIEALQLRAQEQHIQYAINLSPAVLTNHALQKRILSMIQDAQLGPYLTLEFSEFSVLEEEKEFRAFLDKAAANNLRVALDQFGMQKKSLQLLTYLSLSYVKIAPSLILNFNNEARQRHLIHAIVDMASVLDTPVIAIGVDTQERLHQLIKLGITAVQGHLFDENKPLFYQRLSKHKPYS